MTGTTAFSCVEVVGLKLFLSAATEEEEDEDEEGKFALAARRRDGRDGARVGETGEEETKGEEEGGRSADRGRAGTSAVSR
jgi:hypothetical protein